MKRYCLLLLATAALAYAAALAVACWVRGPIEAEYWVGEAVAVKRHLAIRIAGPKVVFLGGSSVLFGVDAAGLERRLGVPVFNEGLHGGLRLPFLLGEGRRIAQPGDLVVLALEATFYGPRPDWDAWQVTNAAAWDPSSLDALPLGRRLLVLARAASPDLWWELLAARTGEIVAPERRRAARLARQPEAALAALYDGGTLREPGSPLPYQAWNLGPRGDIPAFAGTPVTQPPRPADKPDGIAPAAREELARFAADMAARGVRVAIAYPPYMAGGAPAPGWPEAEARFRQAAAGLGLPLLDRRDEAFYPPPLFFEFSYHLNAAGRELHTRHLAEALLRSGLLPGNFIHGSEMK